MKILFVTTVYSLDLNGASRFAHILSESSLSVTILTENVEETTFVKNVVVDLSWLKRKVGFLSRIKLYQKKIKELAPAFDVVIFNHPLLAYGLQRLDIPFVVFIHDYEISHFWGQFSKKAFLNMLYWPFERNAIRSSSFVVANSNYVKSCIAKNYSVKVDSLFLVYQAFQEELPLQSPFTPPRQLSSSSPIKIIFVKNDYVRGGLLDLIEALRTLGEYEWELTVVGCTPSLPEVKHITYQIKGGLPHQSVLELMQSHDIYCVPSRREALGVANMEAMACGVPVVTTDAGGIPEVITDREGWIAKPQDPASLAAVIADCVDQPQLRVIKAELAREKVKQFSVDRMMERLSDILEKAVSHRK